jgi:hypothetical protein
VWLLLRCQLLRCLSAPLKEGRIFTTVDYGSAADIGRDVAAAALLPANI